MNITRYDYEVVSFAGSIVEGSNGHIYLYDYLYSYIFELDGRSTTLIGQLFNEQQSESLEGFKAGYGYIARRRFASRYVWRVCTVPAFSKRLVYLPGHIFMGYNAERTVAVLTDHGRSYVICVDHSRRPARQQRLDVRVQNDSVNVDRLLVGALNGDKLIKIYDLVSGALVSEIKSPVSVSSFDYVYPVSADTVISSCHGITIIKNDQIVLRDSRFRPWNIASRRDRVIAKALVRHAIKHVTLSCLVYINTKDGNICTIYNAQNAVLLSDRLAVLAATGNSWFIIPYSQLDAEPANHIVISPLRRSAVLISEAPLLL